MEIKFKKYHGLGNDYLFIDAINNDYSKVDLADLSKRMSHRNLGIGSDGIILLLPAQDDKNDFRYRIINSDGSEAEMCGNGIRCFAKFIFDNDFSDKKILRIETLAGVIIPEIVEFDDGGKVKTVKVNMGKPILQGKKIPSTYEMEKVVSEELNVNGQKLDITLVSMGNPHCVIFKDEVTDDDVLVLGPKIEVAKVFPNKINVEFVKVLNASEIEMRVWERGAGETMACGTGACATGVAGVLNGLTERKVVVHLLGGDLKIDWDEESGNVFMTGPADYVFDGVFDY